MVPDGFHMEKNKCKATSLLVIFLNLDMLLHNYMNEMFYVFLCEKNTIFFQI